MTDKINLIEGLDHARSADLILVNTPLIDYIDQKRAYNAEDLLPPLGLGYIATEASKRGHNVGLLDAEAKQTSIAHLAATINNLKPRYVGINALTPTMRVLDLIMKALDPSIPVILGGAHPTALPVDVLEKFALQDRQVIAVSGEGETVTGQILDGERYGNLPGTYWLDNGIVRTNLLGGKGRATAYDDLNDVPRLDRRYLINDPAKDAHTGLYEARMLATRGCPFTCKFCSGARDALGQPMRKRDNEVVVDEITDLVREYGVESIRLIDDLFMRSETQMNDFIDTLEHNNVNVQFDLTSRVNIMTRFSPQLWDRLAGRIHEISVGIEHGVKRVRDTAEKGILDEHITKTLHEGTSRGVKFKLYGIVGLPGASLEEDEKSIDIFKKFITDHPGKVRASLFIFRPYPGTKYWDELLQKGWTKEQMLEMSGDETQSNEKRARHAVAVENHFGEASVPQMTDMLLRFNAWQNNFFGEK